MLSRYARKMLMIVGSVYCLCAASVMVSMLLVGGCQWHCATINDSRITVSVSDPEVLCLMLSFHHKQSPVASKCSHMLDKYY